MENLSFGAIIFVVVIFFLWAKVPALMWFLSGVGSGLFVFFSGGATPPSLLIGSALILAGVIPIYLAYQKGGP